MIGIVEKFIFREKNGWTPNFFSKNWGYPPITKFFAGGSAAINEFISVVGAPAKKLKKKGRHTKKG